MVVRNTCVLFLLIMFDWSSEPDGIILISKHETTIFLKEDITFCTMEIYLDENQKISDVKQYDGLCIKP